MADRVMHHCAACEGEDPESGPARRRSIGNPGGPAEAPPIVYEVLRSAGEPLDASARTFLEPRFGYDFSQVRVHTDARAEASARAVNAHAYTVGRDVVMPSHAYQPGTSSGRQLLAHELSHVVQQSSEAGPGTARTLQRQASSGTSTGTSTEEDLPQPRLTLQVPFGFATFQAPLGGSNGVSSILRAPSATNTPFDTLYQPNLATVLNWSLHSGERGFELGLGLQGAGLFGGAGAGGQLAGYLQPTWVFLTWGAQNQHQLQVYLQPSVAEAFSSNRTVAGTSVSVPLGVQWAWTLRESERSQWQLFAGVSGGYQHTDLGNAPAGTPNPQDAGFIGVTIGFQFNRVFLRYPREQPSRPERGVQQAPPLAPPPQQTPPPQTQQSRPVQTPPAQTPAPTPQPAPSPVASTPTSLEIFFRFDRPQASTGEARSVLASDGPDAVTQLQQVLRDNPHLRVQLIGAASGEGDAAYNLDLGRRRAEWVAQQLPEARLYDPPASDLRPECIRYRAGIVSCGASGAKQQPADPHDRRVLARFFTP